tara:strand:- start:11490 stop:12206 length:717 start_codon:yes stop_codon:yes gene_type:complete
MKNFNIDINLKFIFNMDILLNDFQDYSLWVVSKEHLSDVSRFILRVNHQVHLNSNIINYADLVKTKELDLKSFSTSYFYAIKNREQEIVGTIKAEKWDGKSKLPIEDDFDINVDDILNRLDFKPNEIWHIGRFAIDQQKIRKDFLLRNNRITILKLLLTSVLQHVCMNSNNVYLAESDKKLFDKLKLMGINSSQIGESKMYLGSETVPIFNTAKGVEKFVNKHKHLCYSITQQELYSA